eukprot:symbB.v1.2.034856.t1/scaffold4576.1/size37795/1
MAPWLSSPMRSRSPKRGDLGGTYCTVCNNKIKMRGVGPRTALPKLPDSFAMSWAEVQACKTESESESGQCDSPSPREDGRPLCGRMALHGIQLQEAKQWHEAMEHHLRLLNQDSSSSGECSPEPGVRLPHFARYRPLPPPPLPSHLRTATPPRLQPMGGTDAEMARRSLSPWRKSRMP